MTRWLWYLLAAVLAVGLIRYCWITRQWPLVHDMQVMHYVAFLIGKGWAPYRQIGDMNMPGAYLAEMLALKLVGHSDFGWRVYDFLLGGTLIAASAVIARKVNWIAGFAAGACFTLLHAAQGPTMPGQRDQVMGVLLVISAALVLEAHRQSVPSLMFPAMLFGCFAGAIKPTVLLLPVLLTAWIWRATRKERVMFRPYLLYAIAGLASVTLLLLSFLLYERSFGAFVFVLTKVLPHYAFLQSPSWREMVRLTFPHQVLLLLAPAVLIAVLCFRRQQEAEAVVLLGVLVGLTNFYGQHKGFPQHQYVLLPFALLWIFLVFAGAARGSAPVQLLVSAALLAALFLFGVHNVQVIKLWPPHNLPIEYLERDLKALGPDNLQGKVQCLDIVDGCLAALFHEQILQQTGATGDLLYFLPQKAPVVDDARAQYWSRLQQSTPAVFILFNSRFVVQQNFDKLDTWPEFRELLDTRYELAVQRTFYRDHEEPSRTAANTENIAYRIYIRRGSPLLTKQLPN